MVKTIKLMVKALSIISITTLGIANAGTIVVNHDEWTTSNTGISPTTQGDLFVQNIAGFFTGGGTGSFLGYSNNFSLNQSDMANAFSVAGHSYTASTAGPFNLATLLSYDGIFLAGNTPGVDTNILIDYVNAGGNVYLAGGTAQGFNAVTEAAYWNNFLNAFDLSFTSPYNGIGGNFNLPNQPHQIFNGVNTLYHNNGNTIIDGFGPNVDIFFNGLYAVYDDTASVPEPGSVFLLAFGLLGIRLLQRQKY